MIPHDNNDININTDINDTVFKLLVHDSIWHTHKNRLKTGP